MKTWGFSFVFLFLLCCQTPLLSQEEQERITVRIRVIEEDTRHITPAMVCISSLDDGQVRIPPTGSILVNPSGESLFYKGIEFEEGPNWIGPVRKTNGRGNNGDRSFVYGLLPSIPYWSEPVMYQTSGDFTIDLPPGTWRIALEHGNEYVPLAEEFVIKDGDVQLSKTYILKRWINLPQRGWYSGDVHVHHPTNKPGHQDFLLSYASAEDVHFVNLLEMGDEHNTYFKQEGFGKAFRTMRGDICLVSGQEDPRSTYGHIVGLNIDSLARDTFNYHYYDLVFQELRRQTGAIAGFSHFSWKGNGVPMGFPLFVLPGEIDFVELLQFSHINTSDYYDYLNLGLRLTAAAGSDLPWGSTLGEVRTFVYTGKEFSADAWFEGLKAGHTFVSNGPVIFLEIDGQLPGSELGKKSGSKSDLILKVISNPGIGVINRVAVFNNDGLLLEKLNLEKCDSMDIHLRFKNKESQWITAAVYCDNGAVAHTTPVYIVVDGHPTWNQRTAPAVICRNLGAIKLMKDMELSSLFVDQGMLDRMDRARQYYDNLLLEIINEH